MKTRIITLLVSAAVIVGVAGVWWALRNNTGEAPDKTGQNTKQVAAPTIHLDVPQDSLLMSRDQQSFQAAIKTDRYDAIARVEYSLDDRFVAYSTSPPFAVTIDISQLQPGEHRLQATAFTLSGKTSKSPVFVFTVTANQAVQPSGEEAQTVVRSSMSIGSLLKSAKSSGGGSSSAGSNGGNSGGNSGGDNGDDPNTPWPDTPARAQICGNTALLSGPTSAPAGAVVVPAGDNSGLNLEVANTTYWFATGVHTIGSGQFSQIEPANNSTYVGAPGAILDGQNLNNYAFTQHATNVKIQYLTIRNFNSPRDEGVVNHDSGVGWTVEYSTLQDNGGGAVFAGSNNVIRYNCIKDNGQYGFQVFSNDVGGPQTVVLDHNEIAGNNTDDWESQISGCGCTGAGKLWEANHVDITNNYVHDNLSVGIWADTNVNDMLVEGNYIADNQAQGLFYEIAYNMIVRNNNFVGNGVDSGSSNNSFPTGAIYLSESGGDNRVAARTSEIEIYDNQFENNWSGVILWENADRFCNSPANTSGGTCTLVNPSATLTTCSDPTIAQQPYYSDCRWKTQNVSVHNNTFITRRNEIAGCTTVSSCGYQGIFSNVGTFPAWSPYMGSVIQTAITFNQNNHFLNNTYLGDWRYKLFDQGTNYNFANWQATPYSQDAGSTYNGSDHLIVANALDDDTSTLEGSIGDWISWFSATPSRSTAEAHSGTHSLKVDITAAFGWGVQLSNSNGYSITPSDKKISYWVKLGAGTNLRARMDVRWLDQNGATVGSTTQLLSPILTTDWQKVSADVTPPVGARSVIVSVVHNTGTSGNSLYLDDFVIADADAP